jgi:hypothetical protein
MRTKRKREKNSTEQCPLEKLTAAEMVKIFLAVYGMMGSMMNSTKKTDESSPHLSPYLSHPF